MLIGNHWCSVYYTESNRKPCQMKYILFQSIFFFFKLKIKNSNSTQFFSKYPFCESNDKKNFDGKQIEPRQVVYFLDFICVNQFRTYLILFSKYRLGEFLDTSIFFKLFFDFLWYYSLVYNFHNCCHTFK